MIIISVSMVTTIYCLKLHHTVGREAQAMPSYVRYVLLDLLPIVLFLHPPPDPPSEDSESLLKDEERIWLLTPFDLTWPQMNLGQMGQRIKSWIRKQDSLQILSLLIFIKNWNLFLIEWGMKIVRAHMKMNGNMLLWFLTGLTSNNYLKMTLDRIYLRWPLINNLTNDLKWPKMASNGLECPRTASKALKWP